MSDDRAITAEIALEPGVNNQQVLGDLLQSDALLKSMQATGAGGGDGGTGKIGKGARAASQGVRGLSASVNLLGGEMSATATSVTTIIPLLPIMSTGINAVAGSIGFLESVFPPFLIVAAAAAAIVGTVTAGVSLYNDSVKDTEERINAVRDATIAYNEALNQTSDEIENQLTLNDELLATNLANQKATQDAIDALNEPSSGLGGFIFGLADGLGLVGDAGDELADDLKDLEAEEKELTTSTEGLTDALQSAEVAANDARVALLEQVDQLGDTRKFEQEALTASAEQNAARAESIKNEQAIIREQIATLVDSGDTSQEVQARIEELNSELGQLGQQSQFLSTAAVKAAESQKILVDAEGELEAARDKSARAVQAATSKTIAARNKESQAIAKAAAADRKAAREAKEFEIEQQAELADLRQDNRDDQIKAEKKFGKDIDKLVEEQSFIAAINRQDAFVEEEQERRDAAKEGVAKLQVGLEEERIEREIADKEAKADRLKSIADASQITAAAVRNESKLRNAANNDIIRLQTNRAEQEISLHAQTTNVIISNLKAVAEFAIATKVQVDRALKGTTKGRTSGGIATGKLPMSRSEVRSEVLNTLDRVMG
ncbi:hypothetical protein LCGC14_1043280 [marine sediment metagenome]|uniref:Uncharacterized protein n=1 Tax=marine sediment metagenome TaxID=412755 RepID=A0A0F9MVK6_9ZZZZ